MKEPPITQEMTRVPRALCQEGVREQIPEQKVLRVLFPRGELPGFQESRAEASIDFLLSHDCLFFFFFISFSPFNFEVTRFLTPENLSMLNAHAFFPCAAA